MIDLTSRRSAHADRRILTASPICRFEVESGVMNDDQPGTLLEELKTEHRRLDEQIRMLASEGGLDQLEIARLKKRMLRHKDQIKQIIDSNIPDIIA